MAQIIPRRKIAALDNPKTKYMPTDMVTRFAEMAERPDQLSMADAITLLDVRESQLLERLKTPPPDYVALTKLLVDLRNAHDDGDEREYERAEQRMYTALKIGIDAERTWQEIRVVLDQRRFSVESERRRIIQERTVITIEQARALVSRLLSIVDLLVDDRTLKARIMKEFRSALQVDEDVKVVA